MLKDLHPDVTDVVFKFSRWHHSVNYSRFTQKLKLKEGMDLSRFNKIDNYDMVVIPTEEETTLDNKSYLENKYQYAINKS